VNLPAWVWSLKAQTVMALLPVHQQKRFRFFTVMVDGTFVLPGRAITTPEAASAELVWEGAQRAGVGGFFSSKIKAAAEKRRRR
jgi:hypothetical protein